MKRLMQPFKQTILWGLIGLIMISSHHMAWPQDANMRPENQIGHTEVMPWKDAKQAALVLMFDDNLGSHQSNAIPELEKRKLKGVFYINPQRFGFMDNPFWQVAVPQMGHEYGVHTMTHIVSDEEDARWEIGECAAILRKINPASPSSVLMSYARPGGENVFMVSDQFEDELLKQNSLISRDKGGFYVYQAQDASALTQWLGGVLEQGDMGKILFHGVGGDFLSVPMDVFNPFLDAVAASQDKLWVAGHMPIHKYHTEFQSARVDLIESSEQKIVLALTAQTDPVLYDQPLTLRTWVPAQWTRCLVTQNKKQSVCDVSQGFVQYEALPCDHQLTLQPEK